MIWGRQNKLTATMIMLTCMFTRSCESSTKGVATCGSGHTDNWQWSAAAVKCGAQRATRSQLRDNLRNRWIVVAGDSITRFFYAALLRALTDDGEHHLPRCLQHARTEAHPLRGEGHAEAHMTPHPFACYAFLTPRIRPSFTLPLPMANHPVEPYNDKLCFQDRSG